MPFTQSFTKSTYSYGRFLEFYENFPNNFSQNSFSTLKKRLIVFCGADKFLVGFKNYDVIET